MDKLKPHFFLSSFREKESDSFVQKLVKHFDWILFLDVIALCAIGLMMIYSASFRLKSHPSLVSKQLLAFGLGLFFLFLFAFLNYQIFDHNRRFLLICSVVMLLTVLVFGHTHRGNSAWLQIGPFSFQASEIAKLFVILILASWCSKKEDEMIYLRSLLFPLGIVLLHIFLILLEPDFGSTMVYFPLLIAMLYISGTPIPILLSVLLFGFVFSGFILLHAYFYLNPPLTGVGIYSFFYKSMRIGKEYGIVLFTVGFLLTGIGWFLKGLRFQIQSIYFFYVFFILSFGWTTSSLFIHLMKAYQLKRLMVFLNPELDRMGFGYHTIQSVIALGSGRIFGKGLLSGTQGRLGFLPENHTDFIFSMLGEEFGFMGSCLVLALYMILIWRAFAIATSSRDRFGALSAAGIGTMLTFYAILNLAMVMGFAPVVGIPLPFLSYGGSSLVGSLAAVGILLSIHIRRFTY